MHASSNDAGPDASASPVETTDPLDRAAQSVFPVEHRVVGKVLPAVGFCLAPGVVLSVVPDAGRSSQVGSLGLGHSTLSRLHGAERVPCKVLHAGVDWERPWVLAEGTADLVPLPITSVPPRNAPCEVLAASAEGAVTHRGTLVRVPDYDPNLAAVMVRLDDRDLDPDALVGAPCMVHGKVIGALAGTPDPERRYLLRVIPLGDLAGRLDAVALPAVTTDDALREQAQVAWPERPVGMVGWYAPSQLFQTAARVTLSAIFSQYDDFRSTQNSLGPRYEHGLEPVREGVQELWVDYVADTGDGFDSTYAVASAVALPRLPLRHPDGSWTVTRRGHLLVFGGDQVYPTASDEEYAKRFLLPFRLAATGASEVVPRASEEHPWSRLPPGVSDTDAGAVYRPAADFQGANDAVAPVRRLPPPLPWMLAIPGNHDWYDNLAAFMRVFCAGEPVAEWNSVQSRSYFVKRLPWGWWLFGVDLQLQGDLDMAQLQYFLQWVPEMAPGDRVILFVAEPYWVHEPSADASDRPRLRTLERVLRREGFLRVLLAGDLHHYRRHASSDGFQWITAGGGGAFLHATHPAEPVLLAPRRPEGDNGPPRPEEGRLVASFPSAEESRRVGHRTLLFPLLNLSFTALLGALYAVGGWILASVRGGAVEAVVGADGLSVRALVRLVSACLQEPGPGAFMVVLAAGVYSFSNTPSPRFNRVAGTLHALAHLSLLLVLCAVVWRFTAGTLQLDHEALPQDILASTLLGVLGGLLGGGMMGVYLWVSVTFLGQHQNEAFSALRDRDWKNFVRLRLTPDTLTIYPVKLRRTPRRWSPRGGSFGPFKWPSEDTHPDARPALIEAPVVLTFTRPAERSAAVDSAGHGVLPASPEPPGSVQR
ncbi:MAG: hypothetical protein HY909_06585 [Deltaproteobacteria bacterium]|nr:hypothetical protein [Deltaproteobacteria bacterium]